MKLEDQLRKAFPNAKEESVSELAQLSSESLNPILGIYDRLFGVGGAGHDINNLLSGVIGYLELSVNKLEEAQRKTPNPILQQVIIFLKIAEQAAIKSGACGREIVEIARGHHKYKPVPLNIETIMEEYRDSPVPKRVNSQATFQNNGRGFVQGDRDLLYRALDNIVGNAIYAIGQQGQIIISTRTEKVKEEKKHPYGIIPAGDYCVIGVEDTGEGIPEPLQALVFDRFFTTKEDKGTGLGLMVVKTIMDLHKGYITLTSSTDNPTYTKFEIYIPLI